MSVLEELRAEFTEKPERNIFGFKKHPKDGSVLYLGARLKDAERQKKEAEALAAATERAALSIVGRYDPDAASELYAEIQILKKEYLS